MKPKRTKQPTDKEMLDWVEMKRRDLYAPKDDWKTWFVSQASNEHQSITLRSAIRNAMREAGR